MNLRSPTSLLGALIALAVLAAPTQAHAMRCNSRLISVGDTALKLENRCGPPDFVTVQPSGRTTLAMGTAIAGATTRTYEMVETRVYRGEPGEMASFVELRRGVVTALRRVHIATVDDPVRCQKVIEDRDEIGKVRLACGGPSDASQWTEEHAVVLNGLQQTQMVNYERWFYDLGAGRFERILTFENGTLVNIEAGDRH